MDNLRKIREQEKITQLRLSIEAGVAQETISGYELGKARPSAETLCRLADYLNTSTDYLLDRTDIRLPISELAINGLSSDELELVALFKRMNPYQRARVLGFMLGVLD